MTTIKIQRLHPDAVIPKIQSEFAAGFDLTLTEDVEVTGKVLLAPTGIAVEIPVGYFGLLVGRSSLAVKKNVTLANNVGIIDADYRGEVKVPVINYLGETIKLEKGERVAQLIIVPCHALGAGVQYETVEAEELSDTARGTGGYGSTGTK